MRRYPPPKPRLPNGTSWNATRDRTTQRRFRTAVLANAGHQCQAIEHGHRCLAVEGLQAHHTISGSDDPATGLALCRRHHRAIDPNAR